MAAKKDSNLRTEETRLSTEAVVSKRGPHMARSRRAEAFRKGGCRRWRSMRSCHEAVFSLAVKRVVSGPHCAQSEGTHLRVCADRSRQDSLRSAPSRV